MNNRRRGWWIALAIVAILFLAWLLGTYLAARTVRDVALKLLGPGSQVADTQLHLTHVELIGLRIPGNEGWPVADALRVDNVDIHPDWMTLFGDEIHVKSVELHGVYFSVLRNQDRQLRFLPTLLPRPKRPPGAKPARKVRIDQASADAGTIDLYDASVRQPPHRMQLVDAHGEARDMLFPKLTTRTRFDLQGSTTDRDDPGGVHLSGWTEFSKRDSSMQIDVHNVDVEKLEPYLLRSLEVGVKSGRFDLQMRSDVHDRQLVAPGHMRFTDLELAHADGAIATFMGLPRRGVIKALEDRKGRIDLDFEMKGPLGDTQFSLNESFALKAAVGVGAALGLTFGGVVEGIGSLGGRGIDAVGDFVGGIFGADDKKDKKDEPKPDTEDAGKSKK